MALESIQYTSQKHGVQVPLSELDIDIDVQRALMPSRLRKMIKTFDPAGVGELLVSQREDGSHFIIDGQHRKVVLEQVDGYSHASCEVLNGLSKRDEARLFLMRNDRSGVSRADRNRNMATYGDPDTLKVQMACQAEGFVFITNDARDRTFTDREAAVAILAAAESAKKYEGTPEQHLSHVLGFYARVWGTDEVPQSVILKALSRLLLRKEPNEDRLYERLRDVPAQQLVFEARAKQADISDTRNVTLPTAVLEHMVSLYNHGLPQASAVRIKL